MSEPTSPKLPDPAQYVVRPSEQAIFNDFAAALYVEVHPVGPVEELLFQAILSAHWNMRRARVLEAELVASGRDPIEDDYFAAKLDRYHKFYRANELSLHRNMRLLREQQTNRCLRETLPDEITECLPGAAEVKPIIRRLEQSRQPQTVKAGIPDIDSEDPIRAAALRRCQNEAKAS
jgi:hypothetical protein